MKYLSLFIALFFLGNNVAPKEAYWGQIGHRTVGHIADGMLSKRASKNVRRVLGNETLAEVSTWMDEIRSDNAYRYANTWHYCTIPDGMTYETAPKQKGGDVIWAIEKIIAELKSDTLSLAAEAQNLKYLVHLVGDIHQPLHVGNGEDRGGNDVKVQWFGNDTNLHSVWDTRMIDSKQFSYTELADWVNHPTKDEVTTWQSASVRDWAMESMSYRDQVYTIPENGRLSYRYSYDNFDLVKQRILQAGVRLAGVINEVYD
ncbi:S1/P1 nuclease [Roseivirga misakiensis]|uniref:S1/P1 Nuclease n=1 Tax=Roseivirga misakiensis TaxID=1563681 RepID=A0A1E5SZJ5_9BACT|nr:S1/P1 nuclease [Roseivirga misakiensis]OEK04529.1 S1/P1 Nuclease [Roseivirga misakiensis]